MGGLFDLKGQLTFYGSYHNEKINVLIHTIFVPVILFTALLFASTTGPLINIDLPKQLEDFVQINLAAVLFAVYASYYVILEPVAGFSFSLVMFGMLLGATWAYTNFGTQAIVWGIGVHVISWIFQFIGHGVFEGRKPALLDNLVQSLVLAPLFVWLHVLFTFGYRPQLSHSIQQSVNQRLKTIKAGNKMK